MNKITQDMRFKQAVIEYSLKHGVTKAAIRYKTTRQNIYRWRKKYDGTVRSLADRSRRPHSHPNQHTESEIKLIKDMRRRNPHAGLVVLWVKLCQRGYTRSISGLYRVLRRIDGKPIKLPNPKKEFKPYEQMQYPGQKGQIDVKYVPKSCLVGESEGEGYFQYTFIDEYSRYRILRHSRNTVPFLLRNLSNMLSRNSLMRLNAFKLTTDLSSQTVYPIVKIQFQPCLKILWHSSVFGIN